MSQRRDPPAAALSSAGSAQRLVTVPAGRCHKTHHVTAVVPSNAGWAAVIRDLRLLL